MHSLTLSYICQWFPIKILVKFFQMNKKIKNHAPKIFPPKIICLTKYKTLIFGILNKNKKLLKEEAIKNFPYYQFLFFDEWKHCRRLWTHGYLDHGVILSTTSAHCVLFYSKELKPKMMITYDDSKEISITDNQKYIDLSMDTFQLYIRDMEKFADIQSVKKFVPKDKHFYLYKPLKLHNNYHFCYSRYGTAENHHFMFTIMLEK